MSLTYILKKDVNSNFNFSESSEGFKETLSDVISEDGIVKLAETPNRLSFTGGDYIHTIVRQIIEALKDITGED